MGLQAAEDGTSHEVFMFCGFALASADGILIESSPKTAGIRTCLATQGEISVPWGKKSCPFLPPLSPPPIPTLPTWLPSLNVFQNLFILRKKVLFSESMLSLCAWGWWSLVFPVTPSCAQGRSLLHSPGPLGRLNFLVGCLAFPKHGLCLAGPR